jgi:hypothetical protein
MTVGIGQVISIADGEWYCTAADEVKSRAI